MSSARPIINLVTGKNATKIAHPPHPYYPLEIEIAGYLANDYSVPQLLFFFAAGCAVILAFTHYVAKARNPGLPPSEIVRIMWFVLSGTIHLFFEGYFAINYRSMGQLQDIFGQLWKEYALSDSRYLTQDPFVLCMETITAFSWGPLCFFVASLITKQSPIRHPIQIIVSLGQLYGDVLYYATCVFDAYSYGISYSRPEAYYFWGYYVLMNWFWIMIPGYLIYESVEIIADKFRAFDKLEKALEGKGKELDKEIKKLK